MTTKGKKKTKKAEGREVASLTLRLFDDVKGDNGQEAMMLDYELHFRGEPPETQSELRRQAILQLILLHRSKDAIEKSLENATDCASSLV